MQKNIGNVMALYPMPVTVVGTEVDGNVNWINIAHVGIVGMGEMMLSMGKAHHSNIAIRKNKTLSVSLVNQDILEAADYVGIVSGKKTDKSKVFDYFYGDLKGAPMIKEAPVTMECEVVDIYETEHHEQFIIRAINTYVDDKYLDESGKIDFAKVSPILFEMQNRTYLSTGEVVANAWSHGKSFNK